jgi:FkbM family methyltransferase
VRLYKRAIGAASRRLDRPELLAVVDAGARQARQEELAISAILASSLTSDATYVDVGSNRGQILREAVRVAPNGRHVAFEPIPSLAAELARSFPQVDCRQMAVGARQEVTQFCHFTQLDGWSGLRRHPGISDAQGRPEYIDVEVSTLDAELGAVTPGVLKIDVEGAELAVLEGARALLARARPVVIFEHVRETATMYGDPQEAAWDLLSELGYRLFSVTGEGPFTRASFGHGGAIVNWLAVPESRR